MQPTLPGYGLITAILHAGGHVIARVKEGISLDFADSENRGCLPDGSRPRRHWTRSPQRPTQPSALPCTRSTSPGGSGTPGARRRHARNSRHATATKTTVTGKPQVTVFAHPASASPGQAGKPPGRRKRPASRGRGTVEPPAIPAATRGSRACAHTIRKQTLMHMRNTNTSTPQET